jgi:DNA polymerase-1
MRCLAVITEDKGLLAAFLRGEDIHNWMSDRAFGDHEPMHRHIIKAANYLTIYGGGAKTLHLYLNAPMGQFDISQMGSTLSLVECQEIIDSYYVAFPRVAEWQEETKRFARKNGYVDDYYGRRRYFPELENPDRRVRMRAEREVINMPIAGTAAELFKLSIIAAYGLAVPVLNVHDELVFELPEASLDEMVPKLEAAMQGVAFPVPLVVGSKVGNNLGELI